MKLHLIKQECISLGNFCVNQVVYPCRRKASCGVSNRTAKLITLLQNSSFSIFSFQTCSSKKCKINGGIIFDVLLLLLNQEMHVSLLTNGIAPSVFG